MKSLKYIFLLLTCIGFAFSCDPTDELGMKNSTSGAYVTVLALNSGSFNYFDLDNSYFEVKLQEWDEQRGGLLQSYDFYLTFIDNSKDNGTITPAKVLVKSIPASSFTTNAKGLPETTVKITADEAIAALGITRDDISGSDVFRFLEELKLTDGRVFSDPNSGVEVSTSTFYKAPFFHDVAVVCPSDLGGDIQYVTTNIVADASQGAHPENCAASISGTVKFAPVSGAVGKYAVSDITFGQYDCAWSDNPAVGVTLNDACGNLYLSGGDQYGLPYTIEIVSNDGTELVINWSNNFGDGGTSTLTREGGWPMNLTTN